MILEASQCGGAGRLTKHLLKIKDNDHVEVHEVSGFISETLDGALREACAISKGTKYTQFLSR